MKWSLPFFLLMSLRAGAATFVFNDVGFGSNVVGGPAPGVASATGDKLFTLDINNRAGLIAGEPIRVTFDVQTFQTPAFLWAQSNGTFRDIFTVTAALGGQTGSITSSLYTFDFTGSLPGGEVPGGMITATFSGPFSLTVPWATDLTALSVTVTQSASVDGAGNGITFAGAGGPLTVTTQTVPEPGTVMLLAGALALGAGRRRGKKDCGRRQALS